MSPLVRFLVAAAFAMSAITGAVGVMSGWIIPWWAIIAIPAFFCTIFAGCVTILEGLRAWRR